MSVADQTASESVLQKTLPFDKEGVKYEQIIEKMPESHVLL
jgi:hypothetical protein